MEEITAILKVIGADGGWGVASILAFVVVRLWRELKAKDERIFNLLDKQNVILTVLEKLTNRQLPPPP